MNQETVPDRMMIAEAERVDDWVRPEICFGYFGIHDRGLIAAWILFRTVGMPSQRLSRQIRCSTGAQNTAVQ